METPCICQHLEHETQQGLDGDLESLRLAFEGRRSMQEREQGKTYSSDSCQMCKRCSCSTGSATAGEYRGGACSTASSLSHNDPKSPGQVDVCTNISFNTNPSYSHRHAKVATFVSAKTPTPSSDRSTSTPETCYHPIILRLPAFGSQDCRSTESKGATSHNSTW